MSLIIIKQNRSKKQPPLERFYQATIFFLKKHKKWKRDKKYTDNIDEGERKALNILKGETIKCIEKRSKDLDNIAICEQLQSSRNKMSNKLKHYFMKKMQKEH